MPERANKVRILIADDHPVVRAGLASMLATYPDIEVAGSVADGAQAITSLQQSKIDILLLDLRMPSLNGIGTLAALRETKSPTRAIILTSYESEEEIYQAILHGAYGYLLKASSEEEMIEAIHAAYTGRRHFSPQIIARFAQRAPRILLEQRQSEILDGLSHAISEKELAKSLRISVSELWSAFDEMTSSLHAIHQANTVGSADAPRKTIADIARKAGVSMATVSRVLHNKGKHTEETRTAVMRVVQELDFQLNNTAASLAMMRKPSPQD